MARGFRFAGGLLALLLTYGCASASGSADNADGGELGSAKQAITARPDPSCTFAQFGGHDYWVCTAQQSWSQAQSTCNAVKMPLARIDNSAENDFIRGKLSANAWFGATDAATEGSWLWIDNSDPFWSGTANGTPVAGRFSRWNPGAEPNNLLNEDCGEIRSSDGYWNDTQCSVSRGFVCESGAQTATAPKAPDTACTSTTNNGKTYWTCANSRSWSSAQTNCRTIGMDLVAIEDASEGDYVKGLVKQNSWIGLNAREYDGAWRWSSSNDVAWCGAASGNRSPTGQYTRWNVLEPGTENTCRRSQYKGKTYYTCDNTRTWLTARAACEGSQGMSLARVNDAAENAFIGTQARDSVWLGGSDQAVEGAWRWLDGQNFWNGGTNGTLVAGQFATWNGGEPNDLFNEDCAFFDKATSKWNDAPCDDVLSTHNFVCEGDVDTGIPNSNDCAWVHAYDPSYPSGEWFTDSCAASRAYVCESLPAAAAVTKFDDIATNVREDFSTGAPHVEHADLSGTTDMTKLFLRDDKRFGLRSCVDTLEPTGAVLPLVSKGQEKVVYSQRYLGVPLMGRGYTVRRDATTKALVGLDGVVETKFEAATTPSVSESAALQKAKTALGASASSYSGVRGQLVLYPLGNQRAPKWELTWSFQLPAAGSVPASQIFISAVDGKVVFSQRNARTACAALPATQTPAVIAVNSYQQLSTPGFGDPNDVFVTGTGSSSTPYLLANATPVSNPADPFMPLAPMRAFCDDTKTTVTALTSSTIDASSYLLPNDNLAAAAFMALQRCSRVVSQTLTYQSKNSSTGVTVTGPWQGFDGLGQRVIDVRYRSTSIGLSHYQPGLNQINFAPPQFQTDFEGASIETACHEFAHGVWDYIYGLRAETLESRTLNEAWGDILGSAAEMIVRGRPGMPSAPGPGGFCFGGDESGNAQCTHDLKTPGNSTEKFCKVAPFGGCPRDYLSPDYCKSDADCGGVAGCCDEHRDATVFGHWFYAVASGEKGTNSLQCPYDVAPLDSNFTTSMQKAVNIAFVALRDELSDPNAGHIGLANATINAAKTLYPGGSAAKIVTDAWAGANVRQNFFEGKNADVLPKRSATNVNPWATFQWLPTGSETSWDFQLYFESVDPAFMIYDSGANPITTTTQEKQPDGTFKTMAVLHLGIDPTRQGRYYWRTRPHASSTWSECSVVQSFASVGTLNTTTTLSAHEVNGKVQPGAVYLSAPLVDGAIGYSFRLGTSPDVCNATSPNPERIVPLGEGDVSTAVFNSAQPGTMYYASVRAIGPPQPKNGPTTLGPLQYGTCATLSFTTDAMPRAFLGLPGAGHVFALPSPHQAFDGSDGTNLHWTWQGFGQPASYKVRFYAIDANNNCSTAVTKEQSIDDANCANGSGNCFNDAKNDFFPTPNPGGYCWDVISVATNGIPSSPTPPDQMKRFRYYTTQASGLLPGATLDDAITGVPSPISGGGDTYGKPVTLSWNVVPRASQYDVHVMNWPAVQSGGSSEVATKRVSGLITEITNGSASSGRYCWQVNPLFADSSGTLFNAAAQPTVFLNDYCYTSGPKKPTITIDSGKQDTKFTGEQIKGHADIGYVPDDQIKFGGSPEVKWQPSPWCVAHVTDEFTDIKDEDNCKRTFTIDPKQGVSYEVKVETFNSPATATPIMNDGTRVHSVILPVTTATCGAETQACCPTNKCNGSLKCDGGTCKSCPDLAAPKGLKPGNDICLAPIVGKVPVPISWNAVTGATGYIVETAGYEVVIDPQTGCTLQGALIGTHVSDVYTTNSSSIINLDGSSSVNRVSSWSVTAVGACGQRSSSSYTTNMILLPDN